jgi:Na+-translocating ferredoxin:NAD+ oxidoreductase subunit G
MIALSAPNRRNAWILFFVVLLGLAILAPINSVTREIVIKREEEEKMRVISQILPEDLYDNRLLRDSVKILPDQELLHTRNRTVAYRARLNGKPSAVIFEMVAPDGYSGNIFLIVAVKENGAVTGVRVLNHNETPGLGDYIEIVKSNWIKIFGGRSLANTSDALWEVRKDGGRFDFVTRATVSARSIVHAVHRALQYYKAHKEELFRET